MAPPAVALKQQEVAIFNKQYHVEQKTARTVPQSFIEEQKAMKIQRELDA